MLSAAFSKDAIAWLTRGARMSGAWTTSRAGLGAPGNSAATWRAATACELS